MSKDPSFLEYRTPVSHWLLSWNRTTGTFYVKIEPSWRARTDGDVLIMEETGEVLTRRDGEFDICRNGLGRYFEQEILFIMRAKSLTLVFQ